MTARALVLVAVFACGRDKPAPPAQVGSSAPAQGGSYHDLVTATQTGSAVETRKELACAKTYADALAKAGPRVDPTPTGADVDLDDRMSRDDVLRKAKGGDLVQAFVRRIEAAHAAGAALTRAERYVEVIEDLYGELYNGGFHQYFFNSSGDDALLAREAITTIGLHDLQPLLDCALTAFPDSKPSADREQRNGQLARWGEAQFDLFDALDGTFFRLPVDAATEEAFIRAHIADFPAAQQPIPPGQR